MTQDHFLNDDYDDPRVLDWQRIYDERIDDEARRHGHAFDEGHGEIIHSSGQLYDPYW